MTGADKSQAVRLLDVGVLGPFMVLAGLWLAQGQRMPLAGAALVAAGGATIGYNWANFETTKRMQLEKQ